MNKALPLIEFWDFFKPLVCSDQFLVFVTNRMFHIKMTAERPHTPRFLLGLKKYITVLSDQENGLALQVLGHFLSSY